MAEQSPALLQEPGEKRVDVVTLEPPQILPSRQQVWEEWEGVQAGRFEVDCFVKKLKTFSRQCLFYLLRSVRSGRSNSSDYYEPSCTDSNHQLPPPGPDSSSAATAGCNTDNRISTAR